MASCEKCWADALGQPDEYERLLKQRRDTPCTPEEQAGDEAHDCPNCSRTTVHQYARVCMACGCDVADISRNEHGHDPHRIEAKP